MPKNYFAFLLSNLSYQFVVNRSITINRLVDAVHMQSASRKSFCKCSQAPVTTKTYRYLYGFTFSHVGNRERMLPLNIRASCLFCERYSYYLRSLGNTLYNCFFLDSVLSC